MPAWKVRQLSGDAIFVFTNDTGFMGAGAAKYIRDKADYRLDDAITAAAPLAFRSATLFPVKRLPVKQLIICNIYDEQRLVTRESFIEAFCAGFELAGAQGYESFVVPDPSDDWNYFTHRADPAVAAKWVIEGISRSRNRISAVKILTTTDESLAAYKDEVDQLKQYAPSINDFLEPTP